ncbi:hypothetical protein AAMO2058_000369300 [Amorphochlora amoebiformis]
MLARLASRQLVSSSILSESLRPFSSITAVGSYRYSPGDSVRACTDGKMRDLDEGRVASGFYHRVLCVSDNACEEEIRAAYHKKLFEVHPDHGGSPDAFLLLREAFAALTMGDNRLFDITRGLCDAAWAGEWPKACHVWEIIRNRMPKTKSRFGSLFFDDILYACRARSQYECVTEMIHDSNTLNLFETEECRNTAYDSLLWHCVEANRLQRPGCDIHMVYDLLGEVHSKGIPIAEEGWYIQYGFTTYPHNVGDQTAQR